MKAGRKSAKNLELKTYKNIKLHITMLTICIYTLALVWSGVVAAFIVAVTGNSSTGWPGGLLNKNPGAGWLMFLLVFISGVIAILIKYLDKYAKEYEKREFYSFYCSNYCSIKYPLAWMAFDKEEKKKAMETIKTAVDMNLLHPEDLLH